MDSSSIMSFNNDSTYQTNLKSDYNNVSVHELALHAMRDRCLLLQKRINSLESDNLKLKLEITKATENSYSPLHDSEKFGLQQKIAELNKQKSQLLHHVFMVSCENKNLWMKIATLKAPDKKEITKQPLVRTNTYIQSNPRTNLQFQEKYSEQSLEEISLKLINSYIQEKSQLVDQYEQMAQLQDLENDGVLNLDSIGFHFMEDPETDSLKEIQSHSEKFQYLKKEVSQQEKDIKTVIARLEGLVNGGSQCQKCKTNKGKPVKMNDKETEVSFSQTNLGTQTDSCLLDSFSFLSDIHTTMDKKSEGSEDQESFDKICPMCGKTFTEDVDFAEFQSHVESHFICVPDTDSLENSDHSFHQVI